MRSPFLLASALTMAVAAPGAGALFAACKSDDSAAMPSGGPAVTEDSGASSGGDSGSPSMPAADSGTSAIDSSAPGTDSGPKPSDSGAADSAATPSDSGALDAGDAGPACAAGVGATVQAKFDFAATTNTLNGGKGQLLTVSRCDTVVWTNDDDATLHGIESTGGGFTFSTGTKTGTTAGVAFPGVQFTVAGTFTYDCLVHGNMMIGQITVQ